MPIIVAVEEGTSLPEYTFESAPIVIGRLANSDIVVKHSQVSRRHAQIVKGEGGFVIEDLDSTNFVYVNQQRTTRQLLKHGDTFNIGGVADYVFLEQPDAELARSVAERVRASPESSPAAYSLKKTVSELVGELSVSGQRPTQPLPGIVATSLPVHRTEDFEALLSLSYCLNSSLRLDQVFRLLLEKLLFIIKAQRGYILLKAPKTLELQVRFARDTTGDLDLTDPRVASVDISAARQSVDEGQTVTAATGELQMLGTPLKVKSSTIGAILIDRPATIGPFERKDRLFYEAVAHQAAIAIDNARLAEELKDRERRLKKINEELLDKNTRLLIQTERLDRKVAELSALNAISRGLNMVSSLDAVLKLILEKTVELLQVEKGSLLLVNEESDTLEVKVLLGVEASERTQRQTRLKVGEGIAGLALRQGVPIAINDGWKNERFKRLLPSDTTIRNLLCVPMVLNNRKIGVINLTNRLNGQGFSEADKELVGTMAAQAAITIENARLYTMAIFDGLTALYVKSYFHLMLERECNRGKRYGGNVGLVMVDIDDFKKVNDLYGHQVGDIVLARIGQTIRQSLRESDIPARFGGEEFALILPQTDLAGSIKLAERVREAVASHPIPLKDRAISVTVSAGVAGFPESTREGKAQLLTLADRALYEAKATGRNRVVSYPQGDRPGGPEGPVSPDPRQEAEG